MQTSSSSKLFSYIICSKSNYAFNRAKQKVVLLFRFMAVSVNRTPAAARAVLLDTIRRLWRCFGRALRLKTETVWMKCGRARDLAASMAIWGGEANIHDVRHQIPDEIVANVTEGSCSSSGHGA